MWQPFVKAAIYTRQNLATEKYEGDGVVGGDERFLSKRNARRVGIERATEYVGWTIVRNRTKHRPPTKRFQLERSNANLPLLLLPLLLLLTIARIPKVDRSLNFTFFFLFSRVLAWLLVSLLRYRVCLLTHER